MMATAIGGVVDQEGWVRGTTSETFFLRYPSPGLRPPSPVGRGIRLKLRGIFAISSLALFGFSSQAQNTAPISVAAALTQARASDGSYISWREHIIDDEAAGGVAIRGGDGLKMADLDKDGN